MKCCYEMKRLRKKSLAIIEAANQIIDSYNQQGFSLTVRQLYYQFVSKNLLPNTDKSYSLLSNTISDGRLAGMIDWYAIQDRTRYLRKQVTWSSPAEIVQAAVKGYRRDRREGQPEYVEVWVEKDALIDVIEQACRPLGVPCFSCRGYVSQTAMYDASQRFIAEKSAGHDCVLLHLGDHDPSGIDMTRDIEDRLSIFRATVEVNRIALSMRQVEDYAPPPNPTKMTDARSNDYVAIYGHQCWELDALEPAVLKDLVHEHVMKHTDLSLMEKVRRREEKERKQLKTAAKKLAQ